MTLRTISIAVTAVSLACSGGQPEKPVRQEADRANAASSSAPAASRLIRESGIGPVELGVTLDSLRKVNPGLNISRTSDGEGVALVEIVAGGDTLIAYADEEDPSAPVDLSKRVRSLETMSPRFQTAEGVHAGSLVTNVEKAYGRLTQIDKSEIESREYVTFAHQPANLTFRLENGAGLFPDDSMTTTRISPDSRIFSIAVRK
jgi:hypothetical protein